MGLRSIIAVIGVAFATGLPEQSRGQESLDSGLLSFEQTHTEALGDALRRIEVLEAIVAAGGVSGPVDSSGHPLQASCPESYPPAQSDTTHEVVYDAGWILRPRNPAGHPFELKFELHNQFRYTGFARQNAVSFDAAGNPRSINNRNDFDINRGRLVFTGFAFDPDLGYYVNIDYSTVASNSILPLLSWISFRWNDRLTTFAGLGKLPGTWEWQQTSRYTLGTDRTLATTFFRPSISAGVWASGKIGDRLFYDVFVGDGFNTLSIRASELDTRLAYSALAWWEPLEEFGVGFSDLECHARPAIRVGHGLTHTRNESLDNSEPGVEGTVFRLSDGTRVIQPNALRPGETAGAFDVWLYTAHIGLKFRGVSVSSEYYLRWLRDIDAVSGAKLPSQFDHGGFAQTSCFVLPQRLELFARGSLVTGEFGSGDEVSAGFNWYAFGRRGARITCDVTTIDDSPAEQSRTGYVAGGSGTLVRTQLWTFF